MRVLWQLGSSLSPIFTYPSTGQTICCATKCLKSLEFFIRLFNFWLLNSTSPSSHQLPTKMSSRLPSGGAPRLSTAPSSSTKPRQLVWFSIPSTHSTNFDFHFDTLSFNAFVSRSTQRIQQFVLTAPVSSTRTTRTAICQPWRSWESSAKY